MAILSIVELGSNYPSLTHLMKPGLLCLSKEDVQRNEESEDEDKEEEKEKALGPAVRVKNRTGESHYVIS